MFSIHTQTKHIGAHELCVTAVMTALVFVATFVPRIPIPLGYAHLGDAVIFLLVVLLPRRDAIFAACIGSALSDLLGGFPLWIAPTLLIKLVMADIVWRVVRPAQQLVTKKAFILGTCLSGLWMATGYTLFGALLANSLTAGLASTPGLLFEALFNIIAAVIFLPLVQRLRRQLH